MNGVGRERTQISEDTNQLGDFKRGVRCSPSGLGAPRWRTTTAWCPGWGRGAGVAALPGSASADGPSASHPASSGVTHRVQTANLRKKSDILNSMKKTLILS